ncbi:succinate-semialdehyde dehydrogenase / glutarate-semialdehyde dehydrogenase [Yoonia tamlensis]|uniref:Succinate-semialdehyde dehydrogenase / glutarate-semialdehyde dehydrogenase n=1 Tax=Yoonia tamlensis TaxID=390270 RepID=A0A1I6HDZ2_9RHOB|nr:aldehyde dehydrogenase family protein [Yoonia tamlensis]SFR52578.1 succinate-semialdehyde dehydrogenase / glutarate-semialdehyde dehydrogenase [Yoonia tamlensis]
MTYHKKMYIAGELVGGAAEITVENPATEQVVGHVAAAGLPEAQRALDAAAAAFPYWSRASIKERQDWMFKLRDAVIANETYLRDCLHHEMGKPWSSTQEDFDSLKNALAFYAEEIARVHDTSIADRAGTHTHRLVHEPAGVALAFLAWNFPLLNLAFKIGPAMAAGCPIIIRPSEMTPISAYAVGELCHQIGLPAGVVQILCTDGYDVADALTASTIPAMITLIGSAKTARHIMATGATSIKRYSMELGGNAPVLVFSDADLDLAADIVCNVKFSNAGQICVSPNRVFVASDVYDAFRDKVVARAKSAKVGFDKTADIVTGPLIDKRAWTRIKGLIDSAARDGAKVLAGGDRPKGCDTGHFIAPTVLGDVTPEMDVYTHETFGPIVSLVRFDSEADLVARANDGDDGGLTAYIFTADLHKAEKYAAALRYGEIQINGVKYDIDLPHGGIGQSGIGHDCSYLALNDYLVTKRITRALS